MINEKKLKREDNLQLEKLDVRIVLKFVSLPYSAKIMNLSEI
jgi:uncharacterized protein (DUF2164 family)